VHSPVAHNDRRRPVGTALGGADAIDSGRYLQVVYVPDALGDSGFVVTAFELKPKAKIALRRRQRRKRK
jgi:hypothetical protein